jgi:hypothetical protein
MLGLILMACLMPEEIRAREGYVGRQINPNAYVKESTSLFEPDGSSYYLGGWYGNRSVIVVHEADSSCLLTIDDAVGRWVRYTWTVRPDGDTDNRLTILLGMPPRDYAMSVAVEEWVGDLRKPAEHRHDGWAIDAPSTHPYSLVACGLASPVYSVRQAAHDALVAMGDRAIGAAVHGLKSKSAEVRWRCETILYQIRTGWSE